ncbi:sigma-70 family RNA polymerase sigma factor [Clostridium manihotivorum]|uniref:Sigma-70 family RNA polymerase sigma factor n=1 Tax=Clostridium manihotivorum TaxID=2320868 RepID=A0A410DU65_9CLOT|nr:sigma-70 family RNA polymerase sigma factor [Clostridium manihotivorum]QAA32560.1 sigma-70 family RNA polymerase sigma factor [Clostridium manihotivorum]
MDYNTIERLVLLCKEENAEAKEALVDEFTPYIINLAKRTYINCYDFEDIKNECYSTLFKCVKLYDMRKHRFVSYATIAIRNSVNLLIRNSLSKKPKEGIEYVDIDEKIDKLEIFDDLNIEDLICDKLLLLNVDKALKNLSKEERDLVIYIYFKDYTFKQYADLKCISYYKVMGMKERVLGKLKINALYNNSSHSKNLLN